MEAVEPFLSLVIYPTDPDAQIRQADNLAVLAAQKIRLLPGFLRGRIFVSEDGQNIVSIAEWSDRHSFEQFRQSEFGQAATLLLANLNPKSYWLRHHTALEAP
jgi:quinol monooxygenase YgiN